MSWLGYGWECKSLRSNKDHTVRRSLRKEPWFVKSKLIIVEIVIYWIEEISKKTVQIEMKLDSKTMVDWFSFCREICVMSLEKRTNKLGGESHIVEINSSLFRKRKLKKEKREKEFQLLGFVDHYTNDYFLVAVENLNAKSLVTIIEEWIIPETTSCFDCWKAFNSLIIKNKDT